MLIKAEKTKKNRLACTRSHCDANDFIRVNGELSSRWINER